MRSNIAEQNKVTVIMADGDFVILHGRFSGHDRPGLPMFGDRFPLSTEAHA